MPTLTTPEGVWLWSLVLALALALPLRRLIFVLAMRRALRRNASGTADIDDAQQRRLRRRATVSALLLSVLFAVLYVHALAGRLAAP